MALSPQDDKDLVPEFVASEGLSCLVKVGAEADHNYQNYILRGCARPPARRDRAVLAVRSLGALSLRALSALSQIMLFVDGMNGVIHHGETLEWLYTLAGSQVGDRRALAAARGELA